MLGTAFSYREQCLQIRSFFVAVADKDLISRHGSPPIMYPASAFSLALCCRSHTAPGGCIVSFPDGPVQGQSTVA